ncbi:alpha beta-Hydrolase protein [Rutstroemia sp. NJR-2017a BBW]|nr:alpha beta-Hydrolase protein [Rutstroemia sp. NJR-2017a BBW]
MPSAIFLEIPTKPNAPISYTFYPPSHTQGEPKPYQDLIVFVNGLGLPASFWNQSISILQSSLGNCPPILTFDRYGQGLTTARDPLDDGHGYGHDFMDAANDLHSIILVIAKAKLGLSEEDIESGKLHLMITAASVGVPITRLYAQTHPGLISSLLFLNSNIANVNYSDFLPSPSSPNFDPSLVTAPDCSLDHYIEARTNLAHMFDLHVKNAEAMDRRNGPRLLPYADKPTLVGADGDGKGPWLTVVGHDPLGEDGDAEEFKYEVYEPVSAYLVPSLLIWDDGVLYNEGLTKITDVGRCGSVKIAKGCGHFIQMDDAAFVAGEIKALLERSS